MEDTLIFKYGYRPLFTAIPDIPAGGAAGKMSVTRTYKILPRLQRVPNTATRKFSRRVFQRQSHTKERQSWNYVIFRSSRTMLISAWTGWLDRGGTTFAPNNVKWKSASDQRPNDAEATLGRIVCIRNGYGHHYSWILPTPSIKQIRVILARWYIKKKAGRSWMREAENRTHIWSLLNIFLLIKNIIYMLYS